MKNLMIRIISDLRLIIGAFFLAIGLILVGVGFSPMAQEVAGLDIQLVWGLVLVTFAIFMLFLGFRSTR